MLNDFTKNVTQLITDDEENKVRREGNNKNVTRIETVNPIVIIHPKSIIGFIPLNINDKNAHIVVRTV